MANNSSGVKTNEPRFHPNAQRLIFAYRGTDIQWIDRQRVDMVIPPSETLVENAASLTGFWYELADGQGQVFYRRFVQDPIRRSAEILTRDPQRPISRQDVSEPTGVFVLLIPDVDQAQSLRLFSSPSGREALRQPAQEIKRFDLTQEPVRSERQ